VDGTRDTETAVTFFTRDKIKRGEYVLFYRVAFAVDKQLSEAEQKHEASQLERKFNICINLPKMCQRDVATQRMSAEFYDKQTFLEVKE